MIGVLNDRVVRMQLDTNDNHDISVKLPQIWQRVCEGAHRYLQ